METVDILKYIIGLVSVIIIVAILLQSPKGGLGNAFGGGGGGEFYRSKRGLEKTLFNSTILFGVVFSLIALAIAILNA
ncbi:MAG: preprotein translocase subunit SecG [Candidatus Dojkabacteria bacterium]|nr:preprotein translocase subunit SecG [Candidatus Dojkabacteria bacterium]